ncbi:MAG TPA: citramalate synthase [Trueperaceae bacterium]
MNEPLEIYDTTLRDGTQGLAVNFTSEDKVAIARRLDAFGVDLIEGGWPGSNPKDVSFFERMRDVPLVNARLTAFGSTCRRDSAAEEDENLIRLLEVGTEVVTIFGKSWTMHVTHALGVSLEENLSMIERSVSFLRSNGREVVYDAEHFFDGYRADPEYALATLAAAAGAGASTLVLCDTNGGTLPAEVGARIREVRDRFGLPVGIHAHNDSELAVANSLAAVEAGASQVQGTINGYGERCGNANLISIVPNLAFKLGRPQPQRLSGLRELSRFVDERANLQPNVRAAFVGDAAFAHKGGIHVSAVNKRPETYEHLAPELVGNSRRVLLSELSGRANVLAKSQEYGEEFSAGGSASRDVVSRLKELENRGYAFEGAEASFQLLSRKVRGDYRPYFTLHGFSVIMDKREGESEPRCEAVIKLEVGGVLEHTASDGQGPVNALDRALTKALSRFYPAVEALRLVDYKVRVLDGPETGTAAVVRVQLETSDGDETWGTVGASFDIINASYEALLDALEYKLHKDGVVPLEPAAAARADGAARERVVGRA